MPLFIVDAVEESSYRRSGRGITLSVTHPQRFREREAFSSVLGLCRADVVTCGTQDFFIGSRCLLAHSCNVADINPNLVFLTMARPFSITPESMFTASLLSLCRVNVCLPRTPMHKTHTHKHARKHTNIWLSVVDHL